LVWTGGGAPALRRACPETSRRGLFGRGGLVTCPVRKARVEQQIPAGRRQEVPEDTPGRTAGASPGAGHTHADRNVTAADESGRR